MAIKARDSALKAAMEKAEALAGASGQAVGAPVQITENTSMPRSCYSRWVRVVARPQSGMTQTVAQYALGGAGENSQTTRPGKIAVRASVSVVFELQR